MSGTRNGSITTWDDAQGLGRITEGTTVHTLDRSDCSAGLQNALQGKAIPPGASVQVTFDLDLTNDAINVDLRAV
jgi:hypothetical protein